jgi:large subunit ribosomal protein L32e
MEENTRRLLRVRKSKSVRLKRDGVGKKVKLADSWRRPRGLHNKQRRYKKAKGRHPETGYGSPLAVRGMHPCGLFEVRVFNVADLADADPDVHAIRIAASVGNKKREQIQIEAANRGLSVLNYKDASRKMVESTEAPAEEPEEEEPEEETPNEEDEE